MTDEQFEDPFKIVHEYRELKEELEDYRSSKNMDEGTLIRMDVIVDRMKKLEPQLENHPFTTFSYRVLVFEDHDEKFFEVYDVYYDNKANINGYGKSTNVCGNSIEEMKECIDNIQKAFTKPFYWGGDRFPQRYIPNENDKG